MAEAMLAGHGEELAHRAPRYRAWLLATAAREALLAGERRAGLRYTDQARRAAGVGRQEWATLVLGLLDRRALAYTKALGRRRRRHA
jgi:hypothetical protein